MAQLMAAIAVGEEADTVRQQEVGAGEIPQFRHYSADAGDGIPAAPRNRLQQGQEIYFRIRFAVDGGAEPSAQPAAPFPGVAHRAVMGESPFAENKRVAIPAAQHSLAGLAQMPHQHRGNSFGG